MRYTAFYEPDMGHALTALALEDAARPLVRRYPLATLATPPHARSA